MTGAALASAEAAAELGNYEQADATCGFCLGAMPCWCEKPKGWDAGVDEKRYDDLRDEHREALAGSKP